MSGAMGKEQVEAELNKMVSFITQEATEKAHEIRLKADEEFNSEKVKLINTEREAIDREFAANYKKFDLQRKVDHSKIGNQTRLHVLAYQKEQLDTLFEEAANRLKEVHKRGEYKEQLRDLILEGAFAVTEKKMTVQALERDWNLVREVLPQVEETYRKGIEADGNLALDEIKLDEGNPLNEAEYSGGVIVTGYAGRIQVNNTLEERLKICESDALPEVRELLFGENPNRTFFN